MFTVLYMHRVNLSLAIVWMVDSQEQMTNASVVVSQEEDVGQTTLPVYISASGGTQEETKTCQSRNTTLNQKV